MQSVDKGEAMVLEEAQKAGFDQDEAGNIGMAVRECLVNAVVHGNRYNKKKRVHFGLERSSEGLIVTIGDEGAGFDMSLLPDPTKPEPL